MDIDKHKDRSKPRSFMAGSRSPDSAPKEGEANPESSLQNLCPSAFICGSLLHGYLDASRLSCRQRSHAESPDPDKGLVTLSVLLPILSNCVLRESVPKAVVQQRKAEAFPTPARRRLKV
jgi:hypothetical protein